MAHRHSSHSRKPSFERGSSDDYADTSSSRHGARHEDHRDAPWQDRTEHGRCTKVVDQDDADWDAPRDWSLPGHYGLRARDECDGKGKGAHHRDHHRENDARHCNADDFPNDTHGSDCFAASLEKAADDLLSCVRSLGRCRPKEEDTTDLALSLMGSADAVGTDTCAEGDLFARVIDRGKASVAYGCSEFSALAETTGDGLAFASAFTDAFASGADLIISWTRHVSLTMQSADSQFAKEVSRTFIIAIDIEAWDFRDGPILIDGDSSRAKAFNLDVLPDLVADGNLSTFEFDVEAAGENTFADVAFSVFSVEDQLSTVAATADLGVA